MSNNSMQRTALRAAADAERWAANRIDKAAGYGETNPITNSVDPCSSN
jgi:hypothetical protein